MKFHEIPNLYATPGLAKSTCMILKEVTRLAEDVVFGELYLCSM
jgi:hypothetical protein